MSPIDEIRLLLYSEEIDFIVGLFIGFIRYLIIPAMKVQIRIDDQGNHRF